MEGIFIVPIPPEGQWTGAGGSEIGTNSCDSAENSKEVKHIPGNYMDLL